LLSLAFYGVYKKCTQIFFGLNKTDSDFSGGTTLVNATLFTLDATKNGYVDANNLTSSSTISYYQATLSYNSIVYYTLNFTITGQAGVAVPLPAGQKDYGFWGNLFRDAFVPQPDTLSQYTTNLPELFHDKIIVGYYYQVKDLWLATPVRSDFVWSLTLPHMPGVATTTLTIFDSENTILADYIDQFRSIMSAILWILLAVYVVGRLIDFEF